VSPTIPEQGGEKKKKKKKRKGGKKVVLSVGLRSWSPGEEKKEGRKTPNWWYAKVLLLALWKQPTRQKEGKKGRKEKKPWTSCCG